MRTTEDRSMESESVYVSVDSVLSLPIDAECRKSWSLDLSLTFLLDEIRDMHVVSDKR